jgi:rhodanese-related sulfurtransferase
MLFPLSFLLFYVWGGGKEPLRPHRKSDKKLKNIFKRRLRMATRIGDRNTAEAALEYFEHKMAFTTGPAELDSVRKNTSEFTIIDVRAEKDFLEEHIPGAINLPKGSWETMEGLSQDKLNVVYCYSQVCHLAAAACIEFAKAGFKVLELEGGYAGWKNFGLEVEKGNESRKARQKPDRDQFSQTF